jgi:hypothetical protein
LQSEAGKRRRDGEVTTVPTTDTSDAPAPAKPRRRRFDDSGGGGTGGADPTGAGNIISLQTDIAKLQQQVAAMHALTSVPEDQRISAVKVLQDVIAGKQAELAKAGFTTASTAGLGALQQLSASSTGSLAAMMMSGSAAGGLASRVYVGSMPYEASENDVRALFAQFGQIVKIDMSFEPLTGMW